MQKGTTAEAKSVRIQLRYSVRASLSTSGNRLIQKIGSKLLWLMVLLAIVTAALALISPWYLLAELLFVPLALLGLLDTFLAGCGVVVMRFTFS